MKKKTLIFVLAVAGLIFMGIGIALMQPQAAVAPTPSPTPSTQANNPTTYEGKVICLPHKDTKGPQTLECALGIETADGKKYGIKNNLGARLDNNKNVVVTGTLVTPDAKEQYDVVGNITATEIAVKP